MIATTHKGLGWKKKNRLIDTRYNLAGTQYIIVKGRQSDKWKENN